MGFHFLDDSLNDPEQEIFNTAGLLQAISTLQENSLSAIPHKLPKRTQNLCNKNRGIYRDLETSA